MTKGPSLSPSQLRLFTDSFLIRNLRRTVVHTHSADQPRVTPARIRTCCALPRAASTPWISHVPHTDGAVHTSTALPDSTMWHA